MGTWEGTHDGKTVKLSFMEKGIWIVTLPDDTTSGTWTVGPEGNAVMSYNDGKVIAMPLKDGRLIAKPENEASAIVFERADKKK